MTNIVISNMAAQNKAEVKDHHIKSSLCPSRPKYREAKWARAVKVYTINMESKFLLVQGVPALDVTKDLLETFAIYGPIDEYRILDDYPAEDFTKVYWIKYKHIMAARKAKRKLDNRSFFGGILHVAYAPEFESVEETREKLMDRKRVVERKINYARSQSRKEQESHAELHSLQRNDSDSAPTCSRVSMTETKMPDRQSMISPSSTNTTRVYDDEPSQSVESIADDSIYIPFPPRLPPLTVPTYPSQVSTLSTSLNPPNLTSATKTHPSTSATKTQQQGQPTHISEQPRSKANSIPSSHGYNVDVSFPARPPNQGTRETSGLTNDRVGDIHPEESLTGDVSLDRTVLSIREKLKKVNKRFITETQAALGDKKKQRKRI